MVTTYRCTCKIKSTISQSATDRRIPVINMRDGYCNKYWLSERVSDTMMSRYLNSHRSQTLKTNA